MKHVAILVPEEAVLASIDDPRHLFTEVNNFLAAAGKPPVFTVQLVGLSHAVRLHGGQFTVHVDALLPNVPKVDLLFVPALKGDMAKALAKNRDLLPWIIEQYEQGAEVVSLCVGAFLLASTGLLTGKHCSTNWIMGNEFRAMFPDVILADDKLFTEEQGLYTSGGANSYWNLLLHLIEKHVGRDMAILCAKVFQIDIARHSQSPFIIFNGQRKHQDGPILRAQDFIETNYQARITVDQLASMFALGRRNLERRFKQATTNTVVEYIQRVKIEAAKKQFETSRKSVQEVMYEVGYTDTKTFRDVFRKVTGLSPVAYRVRYSHEKPIQPHAYVTA